jgi:hypothetical protein
MINMSQAEIQKIVKEHHPYMDDTIESQYQTLYNSLAKAPNTGAVGDILRENHIQVKNMSLDEINIFEKSVVSVLSDGILEQRIIGGERETERLFTDTIRPETRVFYTEMFFLIREKADVHLSFELQRGQYRIDW